MHGARGRASSRLRPGWPCWSTPARTWPDTLDLRAVARGARATAWCPRLADAGRGRPGRGLFHPDVRRRRAPHVVRRVATASAAGDAAVHADGRVGGHPPGSAARRLRPGDRPATGSPSAAGAASCRSSPAAGCSASSGCAAAAGAPATPTADVRPRRGDRRPGRAGPGQRPPVRRGAGDRGRAAALPAAQRPAADHRRRHGAALPARQPRDLGVGGDWFDVIPLSCGRVALRHRRRDGPRAARGRRDGPAAHRRPHAGGARPDARGRCSRHLDDLAQGTDQVQLATCVYAVFDPVTRSLSFATAGHPPPVLREPDGATELLPAAVRCAAGRRRRAVRERSRCRCPTARGCCSTPTDWSSPATSTSTTGLRRLAAALRDGPGRARPALRPRPGRPGPGRPGTTTTSRCWWPSCAGLDAGAGRDAGSLDGGVESEVAAARGAVRRALAELGPGAAGRARRAARQRAGHQRAPARARPDRAARCCCSTRSSPSACSDARPAAAAAAQGRRTPTRAAAACSWSRCSSARWGARPTADGQGRAGASCPPAPRRRRTPSRMCALPLRNRALSHACSRPETTCATSRSSPTSTTARPPWSTRCSGRPAPSRPHQAEEGVGQRARHGLDGPGAREGHHDPRQEHRGAAPHRRP